MSGITVRKVENKADYKVFFEFPWRHYANCPQWVPPLKSTRRHVLDREHDASWEYLEGEYFIAWQRDEPVGTIAAFINHRHNETWNENIGWFGAMEFVDDPTVSAALLTTAENYVRTLGCDAIRGPATFNLHSEMGVLMNSYDRPPILLMPYNYDYYPAHMEGAGYAKIRDVFSWYTDNENLVSEEGVSSRMAKAQRLIEKVKERRNITVRGGKRRNQREDFEIIYELYNAGWAQNWGFVPLTLRELDSMIKELKSVYDPSLSVYAFVNGDPAGFFVGVPDFNQALIHAYPRPGVPEIISLLKVFWHWKIRPKINTVRLPLGGIKPEYRPSGVIAVLAYEFLQRFRNLNPDRWKHFDGGWVLEDNTEMNDVLIQSRAQQDRQYRLYQKPLK